MSITFRRETEADHYAVENLTREAFWNVYRGYGKKLVDYSLSAAEKFAGAVAITGNIAFYGKCGFVYGSSKGIRYAFAEPDDSVVPYFLVKELRPGFLDGVSGTFSDPEGYFAADNNPAGFESFDALFPKKEKLKLPGQLV